MIKLNAYAKLNLNLHIIPQKLKNGLYPVKFINCQINLFDELYFENIKNNIEVICECKELSKEENLVYKAAVLLKRLVNNPELGAKIILKKNIPIKAGLGGGSSDAAMTLQGLIKLWKIMLTKEQVFIADQLGKDVHYCLQGGICEVSNDGTIVKRLKINIPKIWLLLIIPEEKKPSTAWMYNNLQISTLGRHVDQFHKIKSAMIKKNKKEIVENVFNDFEDSAISHFPIIIKIKTDLLKQGAVHTLLAGSGLSVVGFFIDKEQSLTAFNQLNFKYKQIIWTQIKD